MKKKELLHLHSLMHALKRHAEAEYGVDEEAFEEYESLEITPHQVYERKDEHAEAVMMLSKLLVRELADGDDGERREAVPAK